MTATSKETSDNTTTTICAPTTAATTNNNSIWNELRLFLELAIPTTLLSIGFAISPLLTASYVGRKFGVLYLSGFTLANLTANLSSFSWIAGLFSAADTLAPQAFGMGSLAQVGYIAVRGFVVCTAIVVPINGALVCWLQDWLIRLGQDRQAARFAMEWYRVFVWSLPFWILYNCIWKFLSAQQIMTPLIVISLLSGCLVLPIGLEVLTTHYGFIGSAYAYVTFQAVQALLLLLYLYFGQPHTPGTWPRGFWTREFWIDGVFHKGAIAEFIHLGLGGVLAQSEWVFWEGLGLVIGQLGVIPLSVHTIPNQVTFALCVAPFAAGTALAIRMGITLPQSVSQAKKVALVSCTLVTVFFGIVEWIVYCNAETIIGFFSQDPQVMELAKAIWWKVCLFNFLVALFGVLVGVATGLGKQWTLGYVNFFFLFILGLPICYYLAVVQEGGLEVAWSWINVPYLGINCVLVAIFAGTNWHEVQEKIQTKGYDDLKTTAELNHAESGLNGERLGLLNNNTLAPPYGGN